MVVLALICAAAAFLLSASAGLGGSLILVPALSLLLGPKEGIALAACLLACNNVAKVVVYRRTIPLRAALAVLALTIVGAAIGARLLIAAPESVVSIAIIACFGATFLLEYRRLDWLQRVSAPVLAFAAGATSGFSGTSGPLKGAALRSLGLDRFHLVGAASAVSLAGDVTKTVVFLDASLLDTTSWIIIFGAIPLMPLAALVGRHLNRTIGERAYAGLFWAVMVGYSIRLAHVALA